MPRRFRVALAVGLTRHGQIHAHFGAFAVEMRCQILDHFFVTALSLADLVLGHECKRGCLVEFLELAAGCATQRALFGSLFAFMNVATYCANKFLYHSFVDVR